MKNISKVSFVAVALLTLVGCRHHPEPRFTYVPFTLPTVGTIATRGVGEELISQGVGTMAPHLIIPRDTQIGSRTLIKGKYPYAARNKKLSKFGRHPDFVFELNADKRICIGQVTKETCAPVEHSIDSALASIHPTSFQQTLLYNGRIGNKITLSYREFSGNIARDAFSNEVEYDLSESTTVGYKGARIEIIKATNTELTYKILSGFDSNATVPKTETLR